MKAYPEIDKRKQKHSIPIHSNRKVSLALALAHRLERVNSQASTI